MVPARSDTSLHRLLAVLGVILAGSEANAQAVSAGQQLQKASWISDLQGGLSNGTNLTGVLPTARVNVQQGQNGSACNCFAPGLKDECAQIEATWSIQQAVYVDQPKHPIYICICQGAPFTAQDLASKYSQVPAFLRQWVTSISAIPAAARSAYTAAGHITFFANTASDWADVMVHESAHAQDQNISGSQPYLTALGQDSCVPDDYAGTNNVECYAQDMVVFLYKLWRPYAPPLGIECMTNQLQILDNSQAPLLQAYINKTVAAIVPNRCDNNCQFVGQQQQTLDDFVPMCAGQTIESLLPMNPQMSNTSLLVYPGENICFPQRCCKGSRRLLIT